MIIDRRTFLKSMGLLGATSLTACTGAPAEKLYAYLTPPKDIIPGVPSYYATVCRACPAGCGVVVKTREARPIKLEGNPEHPVNRGKLCARGQAFIQSLYGRHRVKKPLLRIGGKLKEVDWETALNEAGKRLSVANSVSVLTGLESGSLEDVIRDFLSSFQTSRYLMYEPLSLSSLKKASGIIFSRNEVPTIELSKAEYIVSFGADFLDGWISPVQFSREWSERRGITEKGKRGLKVDYLGPRRNLTATASDRFYKVRPESLGSTVLAILHGLYENRVAKYPAEQREILSTMIARLGKKPEKPALSGTEINKIVGRLLQARSGLALYGGTEVLGEDSTAIQCAVLLINFLTGGFGGGLRYGNDYAYSKLSSHKEVWRHIKNAGEGETEVMLIYGSNPVYTLPGELEIARSIEKTKFVVSLAYEMDETAELAQVVLPIHHPLESWGDYEVSGRVVGLMQPVREPLYNTRHIGDTIIALAERAGKSLKYSEYKNYVVARWRNRRGFQQDNGGNVSDRAWEETLIVGGEFAGNIPQEELNLPLSKEGIDKVPPIAAKENKKEGYTLITPLTSLLYDGRGANQDWLWETPDSLTQTSWEAVAEVSADIAKAEGIRDGDAVRINGGGGEVITKAIVNDDLIGDCIALRFGGGRKFGREIVNSGNCANLIPPTFDKLSGELAFSAGRVAAKRMGGGKLVSVSGGTKSEGRYLALAIKESDAKAGRFPVLTRHGEVASEEAKKVLVAPLPMPRDEINGGSPKENITALTKTGGRRWGMVVDLDKCIGCGACVVACYAENNIPVVGKDEVARGRELSWIRIEKHIFERGGESDVRFLPVMCQHCAQAPCETVCPVFASYHTPDGLNAQIYNRCIGTRYCANNCPYKVRRFNYFDYKREEPANQQLNPDVTVRSRGVMEKCTFCIQRIREATNRADAEGREVRDGEITPACVQTCPTGALSFGDFTKEDWTMTKLAENPRGYRLLDYAVNTRPSVVYLRKVYSEEEES